MKRTYKQFLALLIVAATIGTFVYYFVHHPHALQQLGDVPPLTLVLLFGLYIATIGALALILLATVNLCRIHLPLRDGILLTMWSSIINFFGPLQSGPAFRAIYLKKAHDVSLKTYSVATILYYCFFAGFSGLFLLSGVIPWYILIALVAAGVLAFGLFLRTNIKLAKNLRALPLKYAYRLGLATLLQVGLVVVIYTVELKSIDPTITLQQAVIYTGAANFALFVSFTPGAIGFREAFLVFSQNLHHISSSTILAASLLDRAIYVVLLGVMFLVALAVHAQWRLTRDIRKTTDS